MNWLDNRYSQLRSFIENSYENVGDWEKVRKSFQELIESGHRDFLGVDDDFDLDELDYILYEMSKRNKPKEITKIGARVKSDAKKPMDKGSTWQRYKQSLKGKMSKDSIQDLEDSSFEILQHLSMDTTKDEPIKGLVVGNVQSGKTANMAGLMAMAADNGFNFFIVLSGLIENLRQQTSTRLYNDLKRVGNSNLNWNKLEQPSLRSSDPAHNIAKFDLTNNSKERYFTVSLKNVTRLNSLIKWLFSDEKKAKNLKVLVIDDEADQASINTKDIDGEDKTAINKYIQQLVNTTKVQGMNYVAYTATPYANVLNETKPKSLYPKDFIIVLPTAEDYIGPSKLFGVENPEQSPTIDIVREVSDSAKYCIEELQEGQVNTNIPDEFITSINWFLLTVAAMRTLEFNKPISMLIHSSFKIDHHELIAEKVREYLFYLKKNWINKEDELRVLYENESIDFKRSMFIKGMQDNDKQYSTPDQVPDYPSWNDILPDLRRIIRLEDKEFVSHIQMGEERQPKYHKGIHLVIDNSKTQADQQIVRLVYPTSKQMPNQAPAFIVVGGNTLSRGLTLEGLTSTFFLRKTKQADTLMQMARWFGFRKGYEIFPRVWLDRKALERFQFLSQMNEEMREEMESSANAGIMPSDFAPRIKNSPNYQLIRITAKNKMQAAKGQELDFSGFNTQTIYFERNTKTLENNLYHTKQFLNHLNFPEVKKSHLIWRGVPSEKLKNYLTKYKVCSSDIKMSSLPLLLEWIEKNNDELGDWNVIFSSKGDIRKSSEYESAWNIHGFNPEPVTRTKLITRSSDELVNIGALRTPSDLFIDIKEEISNSEKKAVKTHLVHSIREKYGLGRTPQLIIYRIDKGTMTNEEYEKQNVTKDGTRKNVNRHPLNFPRDIIGINILIPGQSRKNLSTYIAATIESNEDID